jgi:hypothetical protein
LSLHAQIEEIADGGARHSLEVGVDRAAGLHGAAQRVAADNLSDVDENRRVRVTHFDDVEQRLLLPGIRHGLGKVETVTVQRRRAETHATG